MASQIATQAIGDGISSSKKGAITQKLKSAQNALSNFQASDSTGEYYQEIAFDELDMLIGKIKGVTSYKALNFIDTLSTTDKKILEKVFNIIHETQSADAEMIIDAILTYFKQS